MKFLRWCCHEKKEKKEKRKNAWEFILEDAAMSHRLASEVSQNSPEYISR